MPEARVTICHVYTTNLQLRCTFGTISTARTMLRSEPPSALQKPRPTPKFRHHLRLHSTSRSSFPLRTLFTNPSKLLPKTPGLNRSISSTKFETLELRVLGFSVVASIITVTRSSYEIIKRSIWSLIVVWFHQE